MRLVTENEIEMVLNDVNSDKAPVPNGFPTFFFQTFCYRITGEVVHIVRYFFNSNMLPNSWNRIYITLISKKRKSFTS